MGACPPDIVFQNEGGLGCSGIFSQNYIMHMWLNVMEIDRFWVDLLQKLWLLTMIQQHLKCKGLLNIWTHFCLAECVKSDGVNLSKKWWQKGVQWSSWRKIESKLKFIKLYSNFMYFFSMWLEKDFCNIWKAESFLSKKKLELVQLCNRIETLEGLQIKTIF